ncbi:MAG TPA: type II toxin-antitoxin system VapC family toxin [Chloroflexota bacterium]
MTADETPLLLDTCAVIWIDSGEPIAQSASEALNAAYAAGLDKYVSAITAWEVGMLVTRGRLRFRIRPQIWFEQLLAVPGMALAELSPNILIGSSFLPGNPPRDPSDRIMAATAREFGYRLVTRDRALLDYATDGHIQAVAC